MLAAAVLVGAGCTQNNSNNGSGTYGAQTTSPMLSGNVTTPPSGGSGSMAADNRTGYQKTQDTIASVLPDGTYEKSVTYAYHSGNSVVDFKLTVQGDVITSASATAVNDDPMSTRIISNFNGALPGLVVGKKINELSIPHNVAGSSLTTAAFAQYVNTLSQNHGAS